MAVGMPSSRRGTGRCAASTGGRRARSRTRCRPRSTEAATASGGRSIATPSSSSTSAAPHGRGRGPVAVLDHRHARRRDDDGRHRRDVDGVRLVAAGADDVDRAARSPSPAARARSIAVGQPGDLRRRSRPWRAARRGTRPAGRRSPRPPAPGPSPRRCRRPSRSVPASSRPSSAGPGLDLRRRSATVSRQPARGASARPRRARRSTSATVSAAVSGSSGCTSTASACDQVASQRSSRRRTATMIGGQSVDLVLELPGHAHAAGRLRLAVEDGEVDAARVHGGQHLGDPAASRNRTRRQSGAGRRPTAVMMASRTSGRWLNTSTVDGRADASGLLTDARLLALVATSGPPTVNPVRSRAAIFVSPTGRRSSAGVIMPP